MILPSNARNGLFIQILGQIKLNKNLRNVRGKITILKMTASCMCKINGMIMRVDTDFDFELNYGGSTSLPFIPDENFKIIQK